MVRVLHTSDWHLGAQLYEKDRLPEQRLFLRWLAETIGREGIDLLVICGDVFDNHAPSVQAQTLYYEFLAGLPELGAARPEIVVTAGNHDSPQFLSAPRELLSRLKIHVAAGVSGKGGGAEPEGDVLTIRDKENNPALAVCAVPFLRERDLRLLAGLSSGEEDEAAARYREAAAALYRRTVERARLEAPGAPVLATGHLYVSGSVLSDDASERLREVGRLSSFPASLLPEADYYALGHLHRPQCAGGSERAGGSGRAGGSERVRYSGSPIPMSFEEADHVKSVVIAEFDSSRRRGPDNGGGPRITLAEVPRFLNLRRIRGSLDHIRKSLRDIRAADEEAYLEVELTDLSCGGAGEFWDEVNGFRAEARERRAPYDILFAHHARDSAGAAMPETFTDIVALRPVDVFLRKLDAETVEGEEREHFCALFREIEEQAAGGESLED